MEIQINGKKAEITLDTEKTVGEVIAGVHNWIDGSGVIISGLELDGTLYGSNSLDNAFNLPLTGVSCINIKTSVWAQLMLDALVGLKSDFEFWETLNPQEQEQCRQRWENASPALFLKSYEPDLYNAVIKTLEGNFPIEGALSIIAERIREIENPYGEIANSRAIINETAKRLEELPLDIQTGKDMRVMETVTLFSSLAEKIYRLVFLLKHYGANIESILVNLRDGTTNLKDYIKEFSTALKELVSAYENNDTVLIGDLAEYELSPRLLCLYDVLCGINREEKQA
jgi:hypothetical protein